MDIFSKKKQINALYNRILERDADETGLSSYYNSNLSLEEIENELYNSHEYLTLSESRLNPSNPLIDSPRNLPRNTTVDFWCTDSEELFNKNKVILGEKWIWSNAKIKYEINSLGYRMKQFDDVDWSNYMVSLGCSFCVGIGLPLEDTYSYRISKELDLDLVNGGISGGNNELMLMNVSRLLANKTPPKLITISWSSLSRKTFWGNGRPLLYGLADSPEFLGINVINFKAASLWGDAYHAYNTNYRYWKYDFLETKRQVDTLCKLANVPVWHFTNFGGYDFTESVTKILHSDEAPVCESNIDYFNEHIARDYHPGLNLQNRVCDEWNRIKKDFGF
jgi:hypothetical protein